MMGVVYIFGRMLAILNSDRARNALAILTAFPTSWWLAHIYDLNKVHSDEEFWWRVVIHALVACVLFVLIGWRLFDRVDNFFDKRFAEDNGVSGEKSTMTTRSRNRQKKSKKNSKSS